MCDFLIRNDVALSPAEFADAGRTRYDPSMAPIREGPAIIRPAGPAAHGELAHAVG